MKALFSKALLGALFVLCVFAPSSVRADTYLVTSTVDTADGACNSGCSLREAVIAANANVGSDTIVVPAGIFAFTRTTTNEDAADQGDLDFTDTATTTITGAGSGSTVIDANGADRVLDILSNASVNMSGLTLTDGAVTAANGATVRVAGTATFSGLTISNATLTGDSSTAFLGGGVYCASGMLTMTDTMISGNTLTEDTSFMGGGGVAIDSGCSSDITATTVDSNSAHHGGGIYYVTSGSTTNTLTDSTISNNAAADAGGGIIVYGEDTDTAVMLNRMLINDNTASAGGGLFLQAPTDITNATIYNNTATDAGGAIGSNPSDQPLIRVAFSTLTHNQATIGAGIYADAATDIHLKANLLASNTRDEFEYDCYGTLTSEDYNFISNPTDVCIVTEQAHDDFNVSTSSYMFTASPSDNGGSVETLQMWGPETLDIVQAVDCTDAAGNPLTVDARGMERPQGDGCDRGSYEKDDTEPVVTATAGDDTIECGVDSWIDAGATANDNFTSGITIDSTTGNVDTTVVSDYPITYTSSTDHDYNSGTAVRTVSVEDTLPPTITLLGDATVTIEQGDSYVDAGVTASDICDDNPIDDLVTDDLVDTTRAGTYTVTYTVTDVSGNTATTTRTVKVIARKVDEIKKRAGRLTIQYGNGTQETITPFGGSNNFRYKQSSNDRQLIVTNGKFIRLFVNGHLIAQKKIGKKKISHDQYDVRVEKIYPAYDTVAVVSQNHTTSTINLMRLTRGGKLNHAIKKTIDLPAGATVTADLKPKSKRVVVTVTSDAGTKTLIWKLTKTGRLHNIHTT